MQNFAFLIRSKTDLRTNAHKPLPIKGFQIFKKGSWDMTPPIFFHPPMAWGILSAHQNNGPGVFLVETPLYQLFPALVIAEENRSVRNTKICISDTPQMIHAGIPHR
jgi:hypothetical protein